MFRPTSIYNHNKAQNYPSEFSPNPYGAIGTPPKPKPVLTKFAPFFTADKRRLAPFTDVEQIKCRPELGDVDFFKEIGRGSFGSVHLAKFRIGSKFHQQKKRDRFDIYKVSSSSFASSDSDSETDEEDFFVIKKVSKSQKLSEIDQNSAKMEQHCLTSLRHPNIIQGLFTFEDTSFCYFAMPYCFKDLLTFVDEGAVNVNKNSDLRALILTFKQVLNGICYLHRKRIIHRDLKPDNILLHRLKGIALISDFGLAIELPKGENYLSGYAGSPKYMAPEIKSGRAYTFSADIYSFVITIALIYNQIVWTEIFQSRFFCDEQIFRKVLDESFVKSSYLPFLVHPSPVYGPSQDSGFLTFFSRKRVKMSHF